MEVISLDHWLDAEARMFERDYQLQGAAADLPNHYEFDSYWSEEPMPQWLKEYTTPGYYEHHLGPEDKHFLVRPHPSGKGLFYVVFKDNADDYLDEYESRLHLVTLALGFTIALLALLSIYERSRDWRQAQTIAQRLEVAEQGSFTTRLAHYQCEEAELAQKNGDTTLAQRLLGEAVQHAPQLPRGWMALSALKAQQGDTAGALAALKQLAHQAPQGLPLAAHALAELAQQTGRQAEVLVLLQAAHERGPSLDVTEALARLSPDAESARARYLNHLEREPSLVVATQWLAGETLSDPRAQKPVHSALEQASNPLKRYRCAACGFEARQHFWQCPGCQTWDSYPARRVEEL